MRCSKDNRLSYTQKAKEIVKQMTLDEKVYLMSGNITLMDMLEDRAIRKKHYNETPYAAGGNEKYGVPSLLFCDGPRGVVYAVVFVVGYDHNDEGEYVGGADFTKPIEDMKGEIAEQLQETFKSFDMATVIGAQSSKEGGDRKESLSLHAEDIKLIQEVGKENKNSTVVLIGGNMIITSEWNMCVSSILMAFYPGQEGGRAIAQILSGEVNPSAKLPFVLPYKESDLPIVKWESDNQVYEYYHGYAKLDKEKIEPQLPFGFGLSYTSFEVTDAKFGLEGDTICASCMVTNTGDCDGTEVVQLYIGFEKSEIDRPVKSLKGFSRVSLGAGECKPVCISCSIEKIKYYNERSSGFELENMEYGVYIGTSAAEKDLLKGSVNV